MYIMCIMKYIYKEIYTYTQVYMYISYLCIYLSMSITIRSRIRYVKDVSSKMELRRIVYCFVGRLCIRLYYE